MFAHLKVAGAQVTKDDEEAWGLLVETVGLPLVLEEVRRLKKAGKKRYFNQVQESVDEAPIREAERQEKLVACMGSLPDVRSMVLDAAESHLGRRYDLTKSSAKAQCHAARTVLAHCPAVVAQLQSRKLI